MARYIMEEMPDIQKNGQKNYISEVCTDRQCKHKRAGATGGRREWFQRRRYRRRAASDGH